MSAANGRTRRLAATALAATLAIGAGGLFAAPAASAATDTITCGADETRNYVLDPGETLTLTLAGTTCQSLAMAGYGDGFTGDYFGTHLELGPGPRGPVYFPDNGQAFGWGADPSRSTVTYVAPMDNKEPSIQFGLGDAMFYDTPSTHFVLISVRVGPEPVDESIPDWVQGYGRSGSSATCLAGWSPSWEQWANGGTGGYVCTRIIKAYGD